MTKISDILPDDAVTEVVRSVLHRLVVVRGLSLSEIIRDNSDIDPDLFGARLFSVIANTEVQIPASSKGTEVATPDSREDRGYKRGVRDYVLFRQDKSGRGRREYLHVSTNLYGWQQSIPQDALTHFESVEAVQNQVNRMRLDTGYFYYTATADDLIDEALHKVGIVQHAIEVPNDV